MTVPLLAHGYGGEMTPYHVQLASRALERVPVTRREKEEARAERKKSEAFERNYGRRSRPMKKIGGRTFPEVEKL
jgi:hypothetical protein